MSEVPTSPAIRLSPHSLEAERAILGGVLIEPDALARVVDVVRDVDFYLERHRKIFGRLVAMSQAGKPLDLVLLADLFRAEGTLEEVGGLSYLSSLIDAVPLTLNLVHYAGVVREKARQRRLLEIATEITERTYDGALGADQLYELAEQLLSGASTDRVSGGFSAMPAVVRETFTHLEAMQGRQGAVTGIPTGFTRLDEMLAGLQPSDLIILAARPAMGKTAFALNLVAAAALRSQVTAAMFSLEMSRSQLALRLLCAESRVDASRVRTGQLRDSDWEALAGGAERLRCAPIYIDDTMNLGITELRSRCRKLRAERGLGLVVVDYLQLMSGDAASREQEIAQISRGLKSLAKELNIPVIALSQLNRSLESRTDKRPMMSDLRESGAIEQDADVILFLYRDAVYKRKDGSEEHLSDDERRRAEVIVGKQRNGPIGTAEIAFVGEHTRFENWDGPIRFGS